MVKGKKDKGYLNNSNLKQVGTIINYEEWQIQEYARCAEDPVYFVKKHMKIVHVDRGLINFDLYPFQETYIQTIKDQNRVVVNKPRQCGQSISTIGFVLWYILFNSYKSVGILANKAASSRGLLARLQLAYENIPLYLQQGICEWNKGSIELENGSIVVASATSSSSARSNAYSLVILDEFAFVPANIAESFIKSVMPTISSGVNSKIVILSTPQGLNMFWKFYDEAVKGENGYTPLLVNWWDVPGRDEAWKERTIRELGSEKAFNQEFGGQFLSSGNTLIDGYTIKKLSEQVKIPIFETTNLAVWEYPIRYNKEEPKSDTNKNHFYVVCFDCAEGLIQDYSVFSVIDVTEVPYKVVARYRSNEVSPLLFPHELVQIAQQYNDAFLFGETDSVGGQVLDLCYRDLEYPNIFCTMTVRGRQGGQKLVGGLSPKSKFGIKMSTKVKSVGCQNFKSITEAGKLEILDFNTVSEISTFITNGSSFGAEEGRNDDCVMSLVGFSWLITQQYFKDWTEQNVRERMYIEQKEIMEEQQLPFPVFDDPEEQEIFVDERGELWTVSGTVDPNLNNLLNPYTNDSFDSEREAFFRELIS